MRKRPGIMTVGAFCCVYFLLCLQLPVSLAYNGVNYERAGSASIGTVARLVKKEERAPLLSTEFGAVSAVDIEDGNGMHNYHLQFITLEPNSLFLPVLLHADMVFYVHTGSGTLSWTNGDEVNKVSLQRGDVYRLRSGTLFYLRSGLESERPRLRVIAIFANPDEEQLEGPSTGPYSSINDLIRAFDKRVLQAAFQVPEEVIEELTSATDTPAIVHADFQEKKQFWDEDIVQFINAFVGIHRLHKLGTENKKKHTKTFNFFKEDPDFKNCNGWSKVVTRHDLHALKGSNIGIFMVNLTKGSMMGPHWNPTAAEVSVVLEGEGMVRVVCPSALTNKDCKNTRFRAEEGDVFTVPRFHPMAQTSFNNGSLVFMGFSTSSKKNHPQFLVGKASVLQTLDKPILGASFNVSNTTIDQILAAQDASIILECTSCAEEQELLMEEEIEKDRQEEEERKREEEEAKRREEEKRREEQRRRQEEEEQRRREQEEEEREEQRRREEEEQRRQEEEEQRRHEQEEEERKREEEQRKREQEEERQRQEEEEQRRREQEEEREEQRRREEEEPSQQEEEEQRRHEQEEEERKREEEQRKREQEEERRRQEEEEHRRQEQEEEERKRREEEQRRQVEEEEREERRKWEEEEQERRQEEEGRRRQQEAEEQRRQEKEEKERRQEERQRREEQRREEEWDEERRREEEEQRRQGEEEQQEEEARQREEERREEEQEGEGGRGRGEEETEGERARREEEERVERERQQEEGGGRWRYNTLKTTDRHHLLNQALRWTRTGKNTD